LETLQFGIGAHNNQIPQLLTRVLLDDIRRFSRVEKFEKLNEEFIFEYLDSTS